MADTYPALNINNNRAGLLRFAGPVNEGVFFLCPLVHLFEKEHILNPRGSTLIKARFPDIVFGVPERAEQNIKYREIRIVIGMQSPAMMHCMALGPLDQITQPNGCFDIGMLKDAEKICH